MRHSKFERAFDAFESFGGPSRPVKPLDLKAFEVPWGASKIRGVWQAFMDPQSPRRHSLLLPLYLPRERRPDIRIGPRCFFVWYIFLLVLPFFAVLELIRPTSFEMLEGSLRARRHTKGPVWQKRGLGQMNQSLHMVNCKMMARRGEPVAYYHGWPSYVELKFGSTFEECHVVIGGAVSWKLLANVGDSGAVFLNMPQTSIQGRVICLQAS